LIPKCGGSVERRVWVALYRSALDESVPATYFLYKCEFDQHDFKA
jgi:hypothetical protein